MKNSSSQTPVDLGHWKLNATEMLRYMLHRSHFILDHFECSFKNLKNSLPKNVILGHLWCLCAHISSTCELISTSNA